MIKTDRIRERERETGGGVIKCNKYNYRVKEGENLKETDMT